jgi:hypothetical protein
MIIKEGQEACLIVVPVLSSQANSLLPVIIFHQQYAAYPVFCPDENLVHLF